GKGTSSRSTKLIHGGLRYLKQGNISLVREALKERGLLCQNGPHLVTHLPFLIPHYQFWEAPFYRIGMKIYDLLAGKLRLEKSEHLTREETLLRVPTIAPQNLRGSVIYYDGQFDDARLAISLGSTCADLGGVLINYMPVTGFVKKNGLISGVTATDLESGAEFTLHAKAVLNATGVFCDRLRILDDPKASSIIAPSQGIHLVLDRSFMPSDTAIIIPKTEDGRVLFFVPWHRHLIIGTTDTPVKTVSLEPKAFSEEVDFILKHAARYLTRAPTRKDILSVFAGLRPLVKVGKGTRTASLSREHEIVVSPSGLITITGGKWTTYRKMAQDAIDKVIQVGKLEDVPCATEHLRLHGYPKGAQSSLAALDAWRMYGSDAIYLDRLIQDHPHLGHLLHPRLPYVGVEIIWAVRHEMARSLEDVLSRRTRALFLDARAAIEIAPRTAALMAHELGKNADWERDQIQNFTKLAEGYLIGVE
ncbi:MAG: FAD-dependent oxidoreductase, partial [Chlamydiota bacterium]